jgi:DNA-binding winged helix-turn-helix (wHTH) protein/tetratricopeptide (TPR) repeat protein
MSSKRKEIFEFGEFRLDVDERAIERVNGARGGGLNGKAFQALVLLVRKRGHLVSKDELINFIWPDTIVEDNNLEKCIHRLRTYLGERPEGGTYIETVRKHGYRFVGKVEIIEVSSSWLPETFRNNEGNGTTLDAAVEPGIAPDAIPQDATALKPLARIDENAQTPRGRVTLMGWIALVIVAGLTGMGLYSLSGSGMGNPAAEPDRAVPPASSVTKSEEAHRLYLLSVNLSEERGLQNLERSLEYLERAVALDPDYAIAWAAKANIHRDIVGSTDSRQHEHYQKSMEAISKALAIDPNLSEAFSALCHNKNRYEYDVAGAETACKRAIQLDARSPVAHKTYANFLYSRGRFEESIAEIKTAMDLQPVSFRNQQVYGLALYYARRYGEAEAQFKRMLELNPNHSSIYGRLVRVMEIQGREPEALEFLLKWLAARKTGNKDLELVRAAYERSGWRGVIVEQIRLAEADPGTGFYELACLYAKIGNTDKAFEYLEKALQERSFMMPMLGVDPQLDNLRIDPRFADLVKRVEGGGSPVSRN